jgi:hypothetical protein
VAYVRLVTVSAGGGVKRSFQVAQRAPTSLDIFGDSSPMEHVRLASCLPRFASTLHIHGGISTTTRTSFVRLVPYPDAGMKGPSQHLCVAAVAPSSVQSLHDKFSRALDTGMVLTAALAIAASAPNVTNLVLQTRFSRYFDNLLYVWRA